QLWPMVVWRGPPVRSLCQTYLLRTGGGKPGGGISGGRLRNRRSLDRGSQPDRRQPGCFFLRQHDREKHIAQCSGIGPGAEGVRALARGDFSFPLTTTGGDEVAEVSEAFGRMRGNLLKTQRNLLESERLATIGRMASSISHDLRHSLAAIVANAEFLCEAGL